jgi:hypothetical protein
MSWFEFDIEGGAGLRVKVLEDNGALKFTLANTGTQVADLRGLFFDVSDSSKIASLSATGSAVTGQAKGDEAVVNLGNGVNMAGVGTFDFGIAFGSSGIGKDDIRQTEFTLTSSGAPLTLNDVLGMEFGVRFTSVGTDGGLREDSLKLTDIGTGIVHGGGPGDLPPIGLVPVI